MCVIPSVTSYAEISSHNGIAFGDKVIGRRLVHESNGISTLKKEIPPPTAPIWGYSKKTVSYEAGSGISADMESASASILNFQPPQLWEVNFCYL